MTARPRSKLTRASSTPSVDLSAFSTVVAHPPQVMPFTRIVTVLTAAEALPTLKSRIRAMAEMTATRLLYILNFSPYCGTSDQLSYLDSIGHQLLDRLVHFPETARTGRVFSRAGAQLLLDQRRDAMRDGAYAFPRDLLARIPLVEAEAIAERDR